MPSSPSASTPARSSAGMQPAGSTALGRTTAGRRDRPNITLAVVLCAQLMIVLDMTVVNIALPSMATGLHLSATSLSWVLNAYALTFGGLLLLGGRAGDILGRRRAFMAGLIVFAAASMLGGFAPTAGWLLVARFAQGFAAAFAAPSSLALITA